MFCSKCGTVMADAITACVNCGAPTGVGVAPASGGAAGAVRGAFLDALTAFKAMVGNPVGALAPAYEALGEARALRAGAAFGVVSLVCFLLGGYLLLPPFMREDLFEFLGFGGVMKCLLFGLVPFLCTTIGSLGVRKAFGGQGGAGGDAFCAGAALLPASFCMLVGGVLGLENAKTIGALTVFALCTGTLMLFAGYTRIAKLGERSGTIGVPLVILFGAWLAKVISTSVLTGGGGGPQGMPFDYPF